MSEIGESETVNCKPDPVTGVWVPENNPTTAEIVQSAHKKRTAQNTKPDGLLGKNIDVKK